MSSVANVFMLNQNDGNLTTEVMVICFFRSKKYPSPYKISQ